MKRTLDELIESIADSLEKIANSSEAMAVMSQQALVGIDPAAIGKDKTVVNETPKPEPKKEESKPKAKGKGKGKTKKEEPKPEPKKEDTAPEALFDEDAPDEVTAPEVTKDTLLDEIRATVKKLGKDYVVEKLKPFGFIDHTSQINPSKFGEIVALLKKERGE